MNRSRGLGNILNSEIKNLVKLKGSEEMVKLWRVVAVKSNQVAVFVTQDENEFDVSEDADLSNFFKNTFNSLMKELLHHITNCVSYLRFLTFCFSLHFTG